MAQKNPRNSRSFGITPSRNQQGSEEAKERHQSPASTQVLSSPQRERERERERESRDRVCISREFYVRGSTRESTEQSANRHAASRMIAEDRGTSADDSLDLESLVDQHWLSCGTRWIRQVPQSTSGPVLRLIDIWITHLQA